MNFRMLKIITILLLSIFLLPISAAKIHVDYCISCGYQQSYNQLKQEVQEKYPEIEISGENYARNSYLRNLADFLELAKMCIILSILSGFLGRFQNFAWIFDNLNTNRLRSCLIIYSTGSLFCSFLMSSGAFEVHFDGKLIWSKLEKGAFPENEHILEIIGKLMGLAGNLENQQEADEFL
ncbi:unnamed protein product [Caenorhabditis angaria]|uniref:Selenoprotein T n=1 Tax=Caenorhabditis angaria TaxID=860376 RepID=A0A9P1ILA5_9PELO|nr:unnamed protein product [Caenorhabditis angaria]